MIFKAYLKSGFYASKSQDVILDLKAITMDDAILETKARYQEDYRDKTFYDSIAILEFSNETVLDDNDWILEVNAQIEQEKQAEQDRIERQHYEAVKRNYEILKARIESKGQIQ